MPRASRACRSGTNCDRFRHSTAMSDGRTPAWRPSGHGRPSGAQPFWPASSAAAWAATHSASSRTVSSRAQVTAPRSARSGAELSRGTSGASYRNSSWMAAAASSTCAELRKLVDSCSTGAGPEGAEAPNGRTRATTGKSAVNRRRLPALAPRQP